LEEEIIDTTTEEGKRRLEEMDRTEVLGGGEKGGELSAEKYADPE
jgi:hypothetical protein